jgi:hypothetical protein
VILRLIFDNNNWEDNRYYPLSPGVASVLFTKIVTRCGGKSAGRGGEDPKIAAAVEAGLSLLMPNGGGGIGISGGGEGATRRHRGRGEGGGGGMTRGGGSGRSAMESYGRGGAGGGDPVVAEASWFAQDLLAPLAAVPG